MGVATIESFHSKVGVCLIAAALVLVSHPAAAQYTAQVLLPPAGLPQNTATRAFKMNNSGQVVGEVLVTSGDRRPVLWTNGVAQFLPLPPGYAWGSDFSQTFLNDHGTVVASVLLPGGLAGGRLDAPRIAIWEPGAAPQVRQLPDALVPPALPNACAADFYFPAGLNNNGHILFETSQLSTGSCDLLWIWDGSGASPSDFRQIVQLHAGHQQCSLEYSIRFAGSHLNDLDHVALEYGPRNGPQPICATIPDFTPLLASGIFANGTFAPEMSSTTPGGAQGLNNRDQFIALFADQDVKFWDGTSIVDLGIVGATLPNDLGQVALTTHAGEVKIYENGSATSVSIPQQIPGFPPTLSPGFGANGFNSAGQILSGFFFLYNGPFGGPPTEQAVLFTPPTPITPIITWTPPADIVYGTALSATQLNATANVPGTFSYNPPLGTKLGVGTRILSVTFTPNDSAAYQTQQAQVQITVKAH